MVLTVDDVQNYISRFEKAIKDPRKLALKKLDIAKLYREARNYEQAKQYAKEYVKINSSDHRAYNFLGIVCEDLTEWDEALKYYKKSIELQRTQKDILIKIVEMYSKLVPEDRQIAQVWADRAEQVVPSHPAIFNLKWQLLTTLPEKDYEQIEDLLAQNLMRNPRDPSLHVKLLEIYMDKGDYREAYTHCRSLLNIQLFKDCKELLMGAVEAIELFRDVTDDAREAAEALMAHIQVLCYLVNTTLKTSQLQSIKDAFYRLDEAVGKSFSFDSSKLPNLTKSELDVFLSEARGQVYHHLAALLYRVAQEGQMSWATASRLACVCFVVSSSIHEPNTEVAWLHQKMPQESQKMIWHSMACLRLCQTDHLILSLEKEHGEEWILAAVADICTEAGKRVLIESIYGDMRVPKKSFLLMDKEFSSAEFELPSPERLLKYDEVAVTENPNNLSLTVWIGMNWHFIDNPLKTEALTFVNQMFEEIQFDVDDLKNCSPFTLSSLDLEVFVKAVVYTAVDKLIFSERDNKSQFEPLLMPPVIGPPLCTSSQAEWWDAAFRLHTGKTWQVSTSKLKSILQRGLEAVRLVGNHGVDPVILKHISESFFSKADEILSTRDNAWRNQLQLECFRRRGYHFGNEALRILEINEGDRDVARPKAPLIPPLLKEIDDKERSEMIESLRMMLADASFRDDAPSDALNYLNGLFTADAAYKQAQIFRDLASKENIKNVEGLRNHLSFLRKSREKLQTCLGRLDKAQMIFREGVEAEIEEIRDAISEQSGISSAPSKVLDLRYSSADEDEQEDYQEDDKDDAATATESKLVLENSILHEQLAVRNHEFSVLAARIHKLEREMSDMRANQSGNETVIKPRRDHSVNTDESSSSVAYVPKDDVTSGSGNLTPRLEPEMSWDPFSPAPVFPVGFFSGLAETVEKIEEEPELETREAVEIGGNAQEKSVTEEKSSPGKSAREDASPGEGEDSYNDTLHVEPVVSLIKKSDVTTGEENEDVVFKEFAKIYRLSEGQWKERGIGFIKILKNRETKKTRILMRRDKVFIVCANHFLTSDMTLTKKQGSATTFIWYTAADSSEENPQPETFAIRFKTEESANEFSKAFENNRTPVTGDVNNLSTDVEADEQNVSLEKSHDEATEKSSSEKPIVEVLEVDGKQAESGFSKFDATKFTFKFGQNSSKEGAQASEQTSQGSAEKVAVVSTPKLDFGPAGSKPTTGYSFGFDPSKIKFDFGKSPAATSNPENKEVTSTPDNPFLAALQNSFVSSTSPGSLSFGRPDDAKPSNSPFTVSPFALQQDSPKASTPLTANASQMQKQVAFPSNFNTQDGQTSDLMPGDYINAAVQRGTQNANQGPGMASGHAAEQGRFLQGDWETMQDRYYQDAAYDGSNQYYDDWGHPQNDYFYYDGDYYNGDDFYYGEENSYYANGDGDFEFYDQEPQRNIPTADSDSNSDRLTPQNIEGGEHVPHVVQMIDDDIFVTFVKKASFANRAKAARLQLPSTFFAPSSYPPCSGCRGCDDKKTKLKEHVTNMPQQTPASAKGLAAAIGDETNKATFSIGKESKLLSFADLVGGNKEGKSAFSGGLSAKGFMGAGAMLFTSPKKEGSEDPDAFDPHFKPIVALEKRTDLKTGEEGYVDLFKNRAKLFRFDSEIKQWKERGVGEIKLSRNLETDYCRVLMRRDLVLKLAANHPTMPEIELKPHGTSTTAWVWVSGADYADGEPKVEQFAVKFKTQAIADEFKEIFQECQKTIKRYLSDNKLLGSNEEQKEFEKTEESDVKQSKEQAKMLDRSSVSSKDVHSNQGETSPSGVKKDQPKDVKVRLLSKFKLENTWECPTCMVPNKNAVSKCVSCSTANPNAKPDARVSKPPVFGQQQMSSEKPAGTNIWAKFKTTEGSWECPTCMVPNKNADSKCVSCSTANPNAKLAPSGFSISATNSFSNPEVKPGIFTAPPFGQVKGLAPFGNQGSPFSNPGFSTSVSAFPAPSFQMPSFRMPSFQAPSSTTVKDQCDEISSANESSNSDHWECPTCSVRNSLTAKTCESCKTENPSTPKDSVSPTITLRRSPLDSNIKAFSSFAPKPGSWECSSCAVTNDGDKTECKACTVSRTGATSASPKPAPPCESPLTSKTEQNKLFKDFRPLFSTPSDFGNAIGQNSTPERSLYITPSEQSSRVDNTEFFTPTGSFFSSVQPKDGLFSAKAGGKDIFTTSDDTPKNSTALKGNSAPQTPESPVKEDDSNFHCSPVVSLKRVENVETGEESEVILFSDRAKLYRFDSATKQWKERGVGLLKILCKEGMAGKCRLIMRRDQVRKLCANHALIPGMCLKMMPSSDKMRIWTTTADIADGEVRRETFAVRFKSHDVLMAFEKEFDKAVEASSRTETEGPTKVQTENETSEAKEKEDGKEEIERKKDIEKVEDFDLKFTKEVLPSDDDQIKAKKLLLPKPFYNAQIGEEDSTNSEKLVKVKAGPPKPMLFETFATSKVDEIAARSDVTSVSAPAPSSPEKFQEDCSASFSPIVQLKKIETETGEEGEIVLFSERAKLYRFDGALREWKVRGVGNLRILKNEEKGMTRLIMRRDHVKKICLNHSVVAGMNLEPMANSKNTLVWFTTADFSDGTPKEEKFAAKFQRIEVMSEFNRIFNDVAGMLEVGERKIEYDKPKNVETLGMAIAASSENRPAGKINEGSAMKETEASTVQKPVAKSTFMWPVSGGQSLFSFGSGASEESSQEPSADVALEKQSTKESESTQFSWPLSLGGSSTLFSFGLSDKPAITSDENRSDEAVATQVGTPGNEQSSVSFPFLSTNWDSGKGPFSFASASKEAVEEIPVTSKGFETKSSFGNFNWGGQSDHQKAETGVIELENVKPSHVEHKTAQTPGSPERQLAGEDCMGEVRALVSLTKIESSSGEEHEEVLFDEWAKAYRFDSDAREWKERGRGHVKILMNKRTEQCRILMRRDQVMKIAFNHAFDRNMKLEANSSTKNSWIWFTHADFADEVPKAEKLAVRFRNDVISQKFKACFDEAVNKAKEAGERCPESEALQNDTKDAEKEVVDIEERIVMKDDDDVVVTYVKEPTAEELMRAKALLLPPMFFAAPPEEENRNRHESSAVQDTASKSSSTGNAEKLSQGFGLFSGSGVSFSDLVATGDNAFAGFHARTSGQQAFKGQGTALFAGTEKTEHEDGAEDAQGLADFKPIVSLEMKETKTGEEEEEAIFAERCKLYRLDRDLNQWKERGVGDLKILVKKNDNKSRIVMRRDVVFKLGANHFIQPGMTPSPKQGVETTWTWKTIADIADGEPKDETFTAKFKSAEVGRRFANAVQQCLEKLEMSSDDNFEKQTSPKPDGNDVTTDQTEDSNQSGDTSLNVSNVVSGKETADLSPKEDQIGTQNTFGGGFSGLDFSTLASNKDSGFKKEDRGWFANAGAKLFDGTKTNTSQTEEEHDAHFEPIVQLKQVEVKSGEEDETVLFEERVKMYRFNHETNQWKERGTGKLKILRNEATGKARLLMRRDVVLKIGANHALTEGMKLDEMKMAPRSLMWKTTGDTSDGPPAEALLAARFRTDEILVEFRRIFEAICDGEEIVAERYVTEGGTRDAESQHTVGSCSPAISQALHDFLDKK